MKQVLCLLAVLLSACSDQSVQRSDVPLSLREAQKCHLSVPLPKSASDIYYVFYSGGLQEMQFLLRFKVATDEAAAAINQIIAANNQQSHRSWPYPQSPLPPAETDKPYIDTLGRFQPVPWFSPESITHGFKRSESASYAPTIWYDSDHSIIYLAESD